MIARSLDVVVLLKLLLEKGRKPYAQLSSELGISASEIHAAHDRNASETSSPMQNARAAFMGSDRQTCGPTFQVPTPTLCGYCESYSMRRRKLAEVTARQRTKKRPKLLISLGLSDFYGP